MPVFARTIENRTSEETQKLVEEILLLGGQFVPSGLLATRLDLVSAETGLPVGGQPLLGGLIGAVAEHFSLCLAKVIPLLLGGFVVG
jgi:hypothetical protein